ncbi:hypothetical protein [Burkholderia pseudomallei]|uniref:Uncharacterized protein n=1 Tax=Burkholderia pseudomallei TaxID=28450 RepID=A0AA40MF44_BURPE|nr:hypothetical protein [Burkholderia pseudomallei]KGS89668.1 hypothetical protein X942_6507 [Burkholderia pseudomallei MSHR5596]KGX17189.1 hypothetical protein Y036_6176 [Burkholderia pseudomallei]
MFTLIAKVAHKGELLEVMETEVSETEGKRLIAAALGDDRALPNNGQEMEDGEVWIDLHDDNGDIVSDEPVCFHRADAADALVLHFGVPSSVASDCLSKRNVEAHYADHRAAVCFAVSGSR